MSWLFNLFSWKKTEEPSEDFNSTPATAGKEKILRDELLQLGMKEEHALYIVKQGETCLENPDLLAQRLAISVQQAQDAIEKLKAYKKKNPDECNEYVVERDLSCSEESVITEVEESTIREKFNAGYSIKEIADHLKVAEMNIRIYVENKFITFSGAEGKKVLDIICKNFGDNPKVKLREMIVNKHIKLQEKICCELPKIDQREYKELKRYFMKFEESKNFLEIESTLSDKAKACIRASCMDNVGELSKQLNRMEKVISDYLLQYDPDKSLMSYFAQEQLEQIQNLVSDFGMDVLISHTTYRTIISDSFDNLIQNASEKKLPKNIIKKLLPLAFYYLKCSLPLEDITQIIASITKNQLTTLDVFHLIFQMSDRVVRGLCIEHYSFSNPVPFYYPRLESGRHIQKGRQFEICKELWYSVQQFNGLVSFGLGWASWNPIGKSHLLDLMFETDFVRGSHQNSAFHFNSIDIQMTKNLCGEKGNTSNESKHWAFMDCHGCPDSNVIGNICQNLDIALIHINHSDFTENYTRFEQDLNTMTVNTKHVYVMIRDYSGGEIDTQQVPMKSGKTHTRIFIPNLTPHKMQMLPVLKKIGYQIIHSVESSRLVGSNFLENLIIENDRGETLKEGKELIDRIMTHIRTNRSEIDFSFLSYYPYFVEYMRYYYEASNETNQKKIDQLNEKREILARQLNGAEMSAIVLHFNEILSQENSSLILWKLAQELKTFSKELSPLNKEKYTLEILWREAILSNKYNETVSGRFTKEFSSNFSNHVERGEPFELIDGDNLRFFNQELDVLLTDLYEKQNNAIHTKKRNKNTLNRPSIVISIFGPQSSGKSTLLNYCFGCKFLTSAGRCTKGVYGSLSKLSQPINRSDHFLILDTEGLDSIEKSKTLQDTSCIHFDRTMVLFCLAVSQAVIINVKGDIGEEMRNLLQICAYSLNKLKVSKVKAPKIFFVLNQQADPDPEKHLNSINTLLEKLNKESYLMETEEIKISDLIQVSKENLFVLPSAFNSICVNTQMAKLFDSDLSKLSPTISFANKCTSLRMSIIKQLEMSTSDNETPFTTMSEWMEMSGVIWDTIVNYQDIVKYRNVEELKCSNLLRTIVNSLLQDKLYSNKEQYEEIKKKLIVKIKAISTWSPQKVVVEDVKKELDEVFEKYQEEALTDLAAKCKDNILLKKMTYLCDEAKSNLSRLIYMEKKIYEDKLKIEIKARLSEIKLKEKVMKFQEIIEKNADQYIEMNNEQQTREFERVWANCFGSDNREEDEDDRDEILDDLYRTFRMESKTMENKNLICTLFSSANFSTEKMINIIREDLLRKFTREPDSFAETDQFIYPWKENRVPIKEMTPFTGEKQCHYLDKKTLWTSAQGQNRRRGRRTRPQLKFLKWVPSSCHALVQYCSGYYNHPDVIWNTQKRKQILLLASHLRDPNDMRKSTWKKLINDIMIEVQEFISRDPNVSHSTVKEIIDYLCHICKVVNYEIHFIEARLTNTAERKIFTFAFALAFKSLLATKTEIQRKTKSNEKENKEKDLKYFLQKVENRKMIRGNWDRKEMRDGDRTIANKFAVDLLAVLWRSITTTCEQNINDDYFYAKRDILSHKSILHTANTKFSRELEKEIEYQPITVDNFVVQFICNRIICLKSIFQEEWLKVANALQPIIVDNMKEQFELRISAIKCILTELLAGLVYMCKQLERPEGIGLDSDSNFVVVDEESEASAGNYNPVTKVAPFKAMVLYLQMYLDPQIDSENFNIFFNKIFEVDGVSMNKHPETYVLFEKPSNSLNVIDEEIFKMLSDTNMFRNTETIFNLKFYVEVFLDTISSYEFVVTQTEYENILKATKEDFKKCVINCPRQCPSCGKFCEKEIHPYGEKCQILTGHQISSMGGNVWNVDGKTAILLMCEDYKDYTKVLIPGENMRWWEFKEKCGNEWDWSLPTDTNRAALQRDNREKMKYVWNKFGEAILQFYATRGTHIQYIPYTSVKEIWESLFPLNYYVCFVLDGTNLMGSTIKYIKNWVLSLMQDLEKESRFKVIVYHGHVFANNGVEKFPNNSEFTSDEKSVERFVEGIRTYGVKKEQLAMLDGLATATTELNWKTDYGVKNIIVHFYIEPTNGRVNVFTATGKCDHGCSFDWKRDFRDIMDQLDIEYKSQRILPHDHPGCSSCTNFLNDETPSYVDLNSGKTKTKSCVFINYKTDD